MAKLSKYAAKLVTHRPAQISYYYYYYYYYYYCCFVVVVVVIVVVFNIIEAKAMISRPLEEKSQKQSRINNYCLLQ